MSLLRSLRIGKRLAAAFTTLLCLLCFTAWFGAHQLFVMYESVEDLNTNWLPAITYLSKMQSAANSVRRSSMRGVLEQSAEDREDARRIRAAGLVDYEEARRLYEATITLDEERVLCEAIRKAWAEYLKEDEAIQLAIKAGEGNHENARGRATGKSLALFLTLSTALDQDIAFNRQGSDKSADAALSSYGKSVKIISVVVAVTLALGVLLAILVTRSITAPLNDAVHAADAVAAGDLTLRIEAPESDEPALLLRSMAKMVDQLGALVGEVRDSSESIATGSREIAQGNADLSQRTESQASSLQETASSMEQLTSSVAQNAGSAGEASQMATEASDAAAEGGRAVAGLIQTMQGISDSSSKIAEIIGVIDSIAFQTNILALNAAVEAARAGEQGRGFAVVASEVRALAQRSAGAAKEIKTLIQASGEQVVDGTRSAEGAGQVMERVVEQVSRVDLLIRAISASTLEQSNGIQQVGSAVMQLDEVTQQNAALVEEGAAAASSLNGQAQNLSSLVGRFRLPAR
ncbi:hypothetical protein CDN99_19620 [Roseateles aquatilis]|uniref:Methyl-accepting chemotaxis protein n=1 Tax=Roseateles aquatilis TaxID=431061 RepID=A0A246J2U4_9BURK|nr:methyl-accepting chemotaxis protein [Roseateles aquatilis]OWQ86916.1 hypothetical protein CDN99_19620 [Roseateles aquatilis]